MIQLSVLQQIFFYFFTTLLILSLLLESTSALASIPVNTSDVIQQWANTFDGIRVGGVRSIITDSAIDMNDGTLVVVGFATGTYIFHTSTGLNDAFAVKLNPTNGQIIWARWYTSPQDDYAGGVCIDAAGNVYITGSTGGVLQGQPLVGGKDVFTVKLTADGDQVWIRSFGTTYDDYSSGCAIDVYGNIFLVGQSLGSIFNTPYNNYWSVFLVKILANSTTGAYIWGKNFGANVNQYLFDASNINTQQLAFNQIAGRGIQIINPIANITNNVTVIITFATDNTLLFSDYPTPHAGALDSVVAAYTVTATGVSKLWANYYQTSTNDVIQGVTADSIGNTYVTGYTSNNLDFGSYSGGSNNPADIFVSKINLYGSKLWTRVYGTIFDDIGTDIAIDNSGGIYVIGYESIDYNSPTSIDGYSNPYSSVFQPAYIYNYVLQLGFISKFDTDGARLWTAPFSAYMPNFASNGHTPGIYPSTITIDPISGNIYFAGKKTGIWNGDQWPTTYTVTDSDIYNDFAFVGAASQTNTNCTLQQLDQLLAQIDQLIVAL